MNGIIGFVICCLIGIACFGIFYKCINWFDNI